MKQLEQARQHLYSLLRPETTQHELLQASQRMDQLILERTRELTLNSTIKTRPTQS